MAGGTNYSAVVGPRGTKYSAAHGLGGLSAVAMDGPGGPSGGGGDHSLCDSLVNAAVSRFPEIRLCLRD